MTSKGITQSGRPLAVATPLGEDVLALHRMTGTEELGRLFRYELELVSEHPEKVDFDKILGQNVTVRLDLDGKKDRYFNGYVNQFTQTRWDGQLTHYRAVVVPWLWFLTDTADCRIFQDMTVPDIIKQVFRDQGFSDFAESLSGEYRKWEYCVQYRETAFDFVSRLMEQEGIYYFFTHANGEHELILADSEAAHDPIAGTAKLPYHPPNKQPLNTQTIWEWNIDRNIKPGTFAIADFDFTRPKTPLDSKSSIKRDHAAAEAEIFDYPGEYTDPSDAENYAKIRIQELQAGYEVARGESDARGIMAGGTFELARFPVEDRNRKYLITSATYELTSDLIDTDADAADKRLCLCRFTAIDDSEDIYRPARSTPLPHIRGPQTAFVVGPSGEEIHTDEHGRVKVQFHWDRNSKADENSSCWVRVSQNWAGKKWGAFFLPRIGQEVIVDFLEGDPDRPIITGRVYNGQAKPPYELPANKTMSTLKSNSSKGGQGFNEFRLEDKKDNEQIFIHAQKNMDIRVNNDRFETIGKDGEGSRHLVIEKDKFEQVKNDRNEKVDNDHLEEIGNDRNLKVTGKEAKAVEKSLSLQVGDDVIEVFKKNQSTQVTKDLYVKADNIVLEAMTNITIKVGQSFIAIEASGISVGTTGTLDLESTGPLSAESKAKIDIKAPMTAVNGDATVIIKGGLVKIN